ncbi:MAG TPA: hypothetical protein VI122_03025, partial [Thermoleophilaceae bacterium]
MSLRTHLVASLAIAGALVFASAPSALAQLPGTSALPVDAPSLGPVTSAVTEPAPAPAPSAPA